MNNFSAAPRKIQHLVAHCVSRQLNSPPPVNNINTWTTLKPHNRQHQEKESTQVRSKSDTYLSQKPKSRETVTRTGISCSWRNKSDTENVKMQAKRSGDYKSDKKETKSPWIKA